MAEVRLDTVLRNRGRSVPVRRVGYLLKSDPSPFPVFSPERRAHWLRAAAAEPSLGIRPWIAGERYPGSSLPALIAAQAARRQGEAGAATFHFTLFRIFLVDNRDISDHAVLEAAALRSGLDRDRFRLDLNDPALKEAVYAEHLEAVDSWGTEAVPTIIIGGDRIEGAAPMPLFEAALARLP
ncbi:MAG: DsbA family protein [candidate division NC10 bacterium]|nr:DsbA family protein [candidate division NC10 bacterium]